MPQLWPGLQVTSLDGLPQTWLLRGATAEGRAHSGLTWFLTFRGCRHHAVVNLSLSRRAALPCSFG